MEANKASCHMGNNFFREKPMVFKLWKYWTVGKQMCIFWRKNISKKIARWKFDGNLMKVSLKVSVAIWKFHWNFHWNFQVIYETFTKFSLHIWNFHESFTTCMKLWWNFHYMHDTFMNISDVNWKFQLFFTETFM